MALAIITGAFAQSLPVNIMFNGQPLEVRGARTLADALEASGFEPRPGDLIAVDGSIIEAGKGEPFRAFINGQTEKDLGRVLSNGDTIEVSDGGPTEEPSDIEEAPIPYTISSEGSGPIHVLEDQGSDGLRRIKTGRVSGLVVEITVREPHNATRRNVSPDVGDDKVIALTFDDGPWHDTTGEVLDVLRDHGAKATFFTVGNRIEGEGADVMKRAASEGHQICTHTYSHASGSGKSVDLGLMTPEEQADEIDQGLAAIESAIGGEASRIVRAPGGNYGDDVVRAIGPKITAEIGWDIDAQDWRRPGASVIADEIKGAWPGAIVLLHDGGGDRSQTVEALKEALPYLKDQGYRFVTIDELMRYPLV
ncbi:polysaccharide deacetylase [Gordonibacter sp. An230]|uniref:polysaccharide deacetylase family protein n=1 Tax=Gordonibacter sp. An230 TaxID=1965592 RepID=UPI000B383DA8|nr:polysaccharide deacetylase family protein [Gordonibacter sp. An230]OUO92454.1 polysaccharide deacetylase [Gordonibacter sp. An230]